MQWSTKIIDWAEGTVTNVVAEAETQRRWPFMAENKTAFGKLALRLT